MRDFDHADGIQLLRTMTQHVLYVRAGLRRVEQELARRSLVHDASKFSADEFAGFCRINRCARENPYGSDEYRAGLRQEKPTIALHYQRNSHHPEHHAEPQEMGWLDIIEMVCDWRGAYLGYGSQGTWAENIARQRERYSTFSEAQWWLIEQVAEFVEAVGP